MADPVLDDILNSFHIMISLGLYLRANTVVMLLITVIRQMREEASAAMNGDPESNADAHVLNINAAAVEPLPQKCHTS